MSKLIVIDRGVQQLRLLECETHGSRVMVRKLSMVSVPEVPESGETAEFQSVQNAVVRELIAFAGTGAEVVGLIGRSHAVLRDLRLPDAPPQEMPGIVQLQAMRELSFPVEQAAIDYEVVGPPYEDGQRRVILAALQLEMIERFQASIRGAQLQLNRLGLRPYLTWRSYRAVAGRPNAAVLVVALTGETLELTVGHGDSVLFSRATLLRASSENKGSYDPTPALVSEVRRTLAAFRNQVPGIEIERIALAAGPNEFQAISEALNEAGLAIPADRFDPFQAVDLSREAKQTLTDGDRAAYVAAVGAAIAAHEPWPIDFINPKKPVVVRDRRKPVAMLAAAVAVLLIAGSYGVVQVQLARGRDKIRQLAERNSQLQDQLKDASEIIRRYQSVDQWESAGINGLNVLERLTEDHPPTKEMYVTALRIDRERAAGGGSSKIALDGLARQQVTASEFNTKLNDGDNFSARPVGSMQRQKGNSEYPFSFKSEITVKGDDSSEPAKANSNSSAASGSGPSLTRDASKKRSEPPAKGPSKKSR